MAPRLSQLAAAVALLAEGAAGTFGPLLPATYLNYEEPSPQTPKRSWFSTFDPKASSHSTFFAVQRTQFGYLGIQQDTTWGGWFSHLFGTPLNPDISDEFSGIVIFSVWDAEGSQCQTVEVGNGAYMDRFTGEGTGCQIKLKTRWDKEPYSFVTTGLILPNGKIQLQGYWFDPDDTADGTWRLVGKIEVSVAERSFGKGGISAFIEQYRAVASDELRMAAYGPQFMETSTGEWIPITDARFSTTSSDHPGVHTNAAVIDNGSRFTMGLAGDGKTAGNTPAGTLLTLTNPGVAEQSVPWRKFVALRLAANLPKGCTDLSWRFTVCGGSALSPVWDFLGFFLPTSLAKLLFEVFMIVFIVVLICSILQCIQRMAQKPEPIVYSPGMGSPGASRSLVRSMMP